MWLFAEALPKYSHVKTACETKTMLKIWLRSHFGLETKAIKM